MNTRPLTRHRVQTRSRSQLLDMTDEIAAVVAQEKMSSGVVIVYVPHTTAGVTINENADPDVKHDLLRKLEELIPHREPYYRHGEGNSDSHVKTSLVGNSVTVLVEDGKLVLGTWQGIYLAEFDGPRSRDVIVKLIND